MSSNNHHHSPPCAFAETLVAYLYGESEADEKNKFEAHLKICASCADELAGFGLTRSAVIEWRARDFSALETPLIEIPGLPMKDSFASESRSWLGGLRNLFSFKPAMVTALVLVVGISFAFYIFSFNRSNEIADNDADKNLASAMTSPTVEIKKQPEITSNKIVAPEKPTPVAEIKTPVTKSEKQSVSSRPVVKVSTAEPKNNAGNPARGVKGTNGDAKKSPPVRKQPIPNLDDADEDEDDTLRLADLFAELDTK